MYIIYCIFCQWDADGQIKEFHAYGADKAEAEARACRVLYEYLKGGNQ